MFHRVDAMAFSFQRRETDQIPRLEAVLLEPFAPSECLSCFCPLTGDAIAAASLVFALQLFVDLVDIARDEARHFQWLADRLVALGSFYGEIPAHKALWEDSLKTRHCLKARLAVIPLVQEAKALDAGPRLAEKFQSANDSASATVMQKICEEEVGHVYKGLKWFRWMCARDGEDAVEKFHELVRSERVYLFPSAPFLPFVSRQSLYDCCHRRSSLSLLLPWRCECLLDRISLQEIR